MEEVLASHQAYYQLRGTHVTSRLQNNMRDEWKGTHIVSDNNNVLIVQLYTIIHIITFIVYVYV